MQCYVIENGRLIIDSNKNWKWNGEPIEEMRQLIFNKLYDNILNKIKLI